MKSVRITDDWSELLKVSACAFACMKRNVFVCHVIKLGVNLLLNINRLKLLCINRTVGVTAEEMCLVQTLEGAG